MGPMCHFPKKPVRVLLLPSVYLMSVGINQLRGQKDAYDHVDAIIAQKPLDKDISQLDSLYQMHGVELVDSKIPIAAIETHNKTQRSKYEKYTHDFRKFIETKKNPPRAFYTTDFPISAQWILRQVESEKSKLDFVIYRRHWLNWESYDGVKGRPVISAEIYIIPAQEKWLIHPPVSPAHRAVRYRIELDPNYKSSNIGKMGLTLFTDFQTRCKGGLKPSLPQEFFDVQTLQSQTSAQL